MGSVSWDQSKFWSASLSNVLGMYSWMSPAWRKKLWTRQSRKMIFRIELGSLEAVWNSVLQSASSYFSTSNPKKFLQIVPDQFGMESQLAGQQSTMRDNIFYNSKKGKQCAKRSFSCRERKVWLPLHLKDISSDLKLTV